MMGMLRDNLKTTKIYDFLLENSSIKKGKKVKYLDLMQGKA